MILFKRVKWRNMLSTGNAPIEVQLNRSTTTLVVGENGAGKSTIIDAICFALFNKGFRNVSKTQLLNSVNQKQMEVELEFSIGAKHYKVIRGVKPNKFEIYVNDIQLNQDADARDFQLYLEEHILKLNYKSFTQIVILGSASFTPFMQLPQGHRREIIEDLLDIRIFSTMNAIAKDQNKVLAEQVRIIDGNLTVQKERVRVQDEYIKVLINDQAKLRDDVEGRITETQKQIDELKTRVLDVQAGIDKKTESISDLDEVLAKAKQLDNQEYQLNEQIKKYTTEINFYKDHDNCPTCKQGLSHDIKEGVINRDSKKVEEAELSLASLKIEIQTTRARIDDIHIVHADIRNQHSIITNYNTQIHGGQQYIQKLNDELSKHSADNTNIDDEKKKLKELAKEVLELNVQKSKANEDRYYQEIVMNLLKDTGIKTKIIRQYLPIINKLVNKFLAKMDFFVKFELDEAFNETIKSRHRDEFSYASFSEGEKQRIDLALMLTFRSVAKLKNTCNTNLILMDEVFDSSLDHNGTDYLIELLQSLGTDTNVFVISHKGDILFDKFRSVIKFEKHNDFSRLVV